MNILRILLCLCVAAPVAHFETGCVSSSREVSAAQSLKAVGHIAEAAVTTCAQLYRDGKITADQARMVMDKYDRTFQPAFRIAVASAVNQDVPATADIVSIAAQLAELVASFQRR